MNANRILLSMDGSAQSMDMVDYASRTFPPAETVVSLFNVINKVPDSFWDWEEDPLNPRYVEYMKGWEDEKEREMRDLMTKAQQVFIDAGFPGDAVSSRIQERKSGIARDVIEEARRGSDVLLIGRKGASTLDEQLMGSVASKVLGKLRDLTVCLVGGKPKAGKLIVGVDGSEGSRRAVELVAKMMGAADPTVMLLHILRLPAEGRMANLSPEKVAVLKEEAVKGVNADFEKSIAILTAAGVSPAKITTKMVTGAPSRAGALLEEARQGGFGAVVVGRRGVSKIEEFQMGRVANKLAQVGRDLAVWIAG